MKEAGEKPVSGSSTVGWLDVGEVGCCLPPERLSGSAARSGGSDRSGRSEDPENVPLPERRIATSIRSPLPDTSFPGRRADGLVHILLRGLADEAPERPGGAPAEATRERREAWLSDPCPPSHPGW